VAACRCAAAARAHRACGAVSAGLRGMGCRGCVCVSARVSVGVCACMFVCDGMSESIFMHACAPAHVCVRTPSIGASAGWTGEDVRVRMRVRKST